MKIKKILEFALWFVAIDAFFSMMTMCFAMGVFLYVSEDCDCSKPEITYNYEYVINESAPVVEKKEGTKKNEEVEKISLGEYKLTAYCPCSKCCGQWANGITSTGVTAKAGRTIAVDPKVIPYGSKVLINGHIYIAEDCGGAIKGNRIDIYFNTHQEALNFGVQYAEVFIIKETE